jgi:hypothetical protein
MDEQLSELKGKEAYEARKAEKQAVKGVVGPETSTKAGKNYLVYIVIAAAVAGLVYWLVVSIINSAPRTDDLSVGYPDQGQEHISVGAEHAPYNSNPPTSGPHYVQPASSGFRDVEIADGHLIHSLEHGLVWISYRPDMPSAVVDALARFARDSMVVITARESNDTDVAVAAWNRLDKFNLAGETLSEEETARIQDFITRNRNRGPEKIPAGQHGGV